jgi:hypothetical protein
MRSLVRCASLSTFRCGAGSIFNNNELDTTIEMRDASSARLGHGETAVEQIETTLACIGEIVSAGERDASSGHASIISKLRHWQLASQSQNRRMTIINDRNPLALTLLVEVFKRFDARSLIENYPLGEPEGDRRIRTVP